MKQRRTVLGMHYAFDVNSNQHNLNIDYINYKTFDYVLEIDAYLTIYWSVHCDSFKKTRITNLIVRYEIQPFFLFTKFKI